MIEQAPILIVGCPRSGTSMIGGAINICGAFRGELVGRGMFENNRILQEIVEPYFIDMGADLVCFSGGKGIRGPQSSGILCGKKDLICSAALQSLDMAVEPFPDWNPPADFISINTPFCRPVVLTSSLNLK